MLHVSWYIAFAQGCGLATLKLLCVYDTRIKQKNMGNNRQISHLQRKKVQIRKRRRLKVLVLDWNLRHRYEHLLLKYIHRWIL